MERGNSRTRPALVRYASVIGSLFGAIAQLVEHCLCKAGVRGSSPLGSTFVMSGNCQIHSNTFLNNATNCS